MHGHLNVNVSGNWPVFVCAGGKNVRNHKDTF